MPTINARRSPPAAQAGNASASIRRAPSSPRRGKRMGCSGNDFPDVATTSRTFDGGGAPRPGRAIVKLRASVKQRGTVADVHATVAKATHRTHEIAVDERLDDIGGPVVDHDAAAPRTLAPGLAALVGRCIRGAVLVVLGVWVLDVGIL